MFTFFKKKKVGKNAPIDSKSVYSIIDQLGIRGYTLLHFETCKNTWQQLVPASGQADSLQGELLRQAEKLRNEAIDQGNMHWDDNFDWFCEFIKHTLVDSGLFEDTQQKKLTKAIDLIQTCGQYAYRFNSGKISEKEVNPMLLAYTDDDLYNYIEDAIAVFIESNPKIIPYEHKDFIYR